jgi:hypothetical protein
MAITARNAERTRAIITFVLLGLWSIACVVIGLMYFDQPWAWVAIGAGAAGAVIVGLSAAMGSWVSAIHGVVLVTAAAIIVSDIMTGGGPWSAYGAIMLALVAVSAPIAYALRDGARAGSGPAITSAKMSNDFSDMLHLIHEHSMLSDNAKRVLFRERELGLLRDAIEQDIHESKYDAAMALCEEMGNVFGYVEEAEAFRARIMQARQERYESEARVAMEHLDELLGQRDWAAAHHEAARIRRLFGESHLVADIDERIMQARDEHKRELEARFLQAAQREDVESAMQLLRELDRYLDQTEAERLAEVAQGVVVKHRENLGVQFKLAVNDHRWAEAARIGDVIMAEFPNTKMADEVRSMIELLRTRATQAAITSS